MRRERGMETEETADVPTDIIPESSLRPVPEAGIT
jgi:hypothetical protein